MGLKAPRVDWELTNGKWGAREMGDGVLFNRGSLETTRQSGGIIGAVEIGSGEIRAMLSTHVWFPAQVY